MSLAKTFLQKIRVAYPSNNDRDELRVTQTGLLTAVLAMTNSPSSIVSPDLIAKAEKSQGIEMEIPVMQKGPVTITNARTCSISAGDSESDMVQVTFKTIVANILMVPSRYENNEIKKEFDFNNKLTQLVEAFKIEMENDLDTAIDANKSQVYGSSIVGVGGSYALAGGAIQVPVAKQDFFFNDVTAINYADDFYDPTTKIISSHAVMPVVSKYINQGAGNAANTNFQYAGKDFTFSNRVTNGAGKLATGYFMPDGTIGLVTRVDADARMGLPATNGTEWFEDTLPGLPFPVGIQYKSDCQDKSALEVAGLAHLTATRVEQWQISIDYAIIVPYNSDIVTKASSIRKFEFVP